MDGRGNATDGFAAGFRRRWDEMGRVTVWIGKCE